VADLRTGTCSWKYPSWAGIVYSAPKGIDYLAEYARRYDTVEVDQWFWSLFPGARPKLPNPADVRAYRAAVPDGFRFTVKIPNSLTLTHYYARGKDAPLVENPSFLSHELLTEFLSRLEPIHDTLGPLMFQFEYLNRKKMASQAAFLDAIGEFVAGLPSGFRFGVEIRNPNYLDDSYFAFLHRTGLAPVFLQGYYMPPVTDVFETARETLAGGGAAVIRLHGPDRKAIERETGKRWNAIVAPRDEELKGIARMTNEILESGIDVYVNANNHYEGSAPLTVERFRQMLLEV
jgi:uncharacterized protein YecE (DUF72 family)